MSTKLHFQTVTPILKSSLEILMSIPEFNPFRLVGGTSLSLQLGHRVSDDIDLFTDALYDTIDFRRLQAILRKQFPFCYGECGEVVGFGSSYIVGKSSSDCVKLDLFYTDPYICPLLEVDNIRLASIEEIIAMKLDVIGRGGRKKIFGTFTSFIVNTLLIRCSNSFCSVIHTVIQRRRFAPALRISHKPTTIRTRIVCGKNLGNSLN